jgi:LCP family protein required for cell wall assembly
METNKKTTTRRIVFTILILVSAALIVLLLTAYLIIHSYINKMNLVTTLDMNQSEEVAMAQYDNRIEEEIELEQEDSDESAPDSSEDEILSLEDTIRTNMEANSTPILYDKDVINILLIGCDTREAGGSGRSDTMIIVSINKKSKKIIVTSLLRDIYLQIPGKKNNRLNAAYAYGGADLLMSTIEQNFKIRTNRYVSIDFYSFIDIVDAVSGVTIEVTDEEIPVINNYIREINRLTEQAEEKDILTASGILQLNGKQALGYSRNRYVGNCDFERTARQRRVLEQIYEKVKSLNLKQTKKLLDTILPQITTNLTEGEIISLILSLPSIINYEVEQWSIPMANSYKPMRIRGMAVLGINFDENINELNNKVYQN